MNGYKKLSILVVAAAILALGLGTASAQEPPRNDGVRAGAQALIEALANLTGLTARELLADREPGTTLADVASAHGVDPAAVIAQAAATLTDRINQAVANGRLTQTRADEILATLEADLTELMNQPIPQPAPRPLLEQIRERGERLLIDALTEATGQDALTLLNQARQQGLHTLAEVAAANGVAPEDVVAAAITAATEQINQALANGNLNQDQADRLLAGLEEAFTNAMNHPIPAGRPGSSAQPALAIPLNRVVVQTVSDMTGLEIDDILEQMRGGSSLADLLAAYGVDADAVVDAVVSQVAERAEQQVRDILNATRPAPSPQTN